MGRLDSGTRSGGRRGRRPYGQRELRRRFLIVCEGEKTEPAYFKAFPVPSDVRVAVKGEGKNTTSLVDAAVRHADDAEYDEVWVVYDKDDFAAFGDAARQIARLDQDRDEAWHAAWSNQSFEVWYLLHFQFFDAKLHRSQIVDKLAALLGGYAKNDPDMYATLRPRQADAIRNARKLAERHAIAPHGDTVPEQADPCTLVHRLVKALNAQRTP